MTGSEHSDEGWRRLSIGDVRRAVDEVKGIQSLPSTVLEMIARAFLVRPDRHVRFHAHRRTLGALGVASLVMPELRFHGLPLQRATTVHVGFVVEGEVVIRPRDGDPAVLGPGDACMIANWSLFDVSCVEGTRVVHIMIPEARLRERGVRIRPARFRLDGPRTLGAPLVAFASAVLEPTWDPTPTAARVAEQALESLAVGLLLEWEDGELDREDLRGQLRRRALEEIALRHRDPELTPAILARWLGVSLRHLQRGFEGSGTTTAEQIAAHRTESAAALLAAPGGSVLTLAEIARATGFGSVFELRNAFRARFGVLPSDFRGGNLAPSRE